PTQWRLTMVSEIVYCACLLTLNVEEPPSPRAIIEAGIKAHGGQENLAKTLTGSLAAKAKLTVGEIESSVSWQETFQLPRRYHRSIKGVIGGKEFSMEYAITDGAGWICQNGGPPKEIPSKEMKLEKLSLDRTWNAFLAILPNNLTDRVKLTAAEKEK